MTAKNTKNFLNNLLFDNIDKIQSGSFQSILKTITSARGETLDEYKKQLPAILKTHTTKSKLNAKMLKSEFNSPGLDLPKDVILSGKVHYTFNNADKYGNTHPINRSKNFTVPLKSMTRKQLKNENYINQLAEEYITLNTEGMSSSEFLGNVSTSNIFSAIASNRGLSSISMGHKKHSIKMLESADAVNINEGECVNQVV